MKLTSEQVELAAEAMWRSWGGTGTWEGLAAKSGFLQAVQAAAPFLQQLWDKPTEKEVAAMYYDAHNSGSTNALETQQFVLSEFVRRRNRVIGPKPLDPRLPLIRDAIAEWHDGNGETASECATRILALVDALAPDGTKTINDVRRARGEFPIK